MKQISEILMIDAHNLSFAYKKQVFIVIGRDGRLTVSIFNDQFDESFKRPVIATIDMEKGFIIIDGGYKFEVLPQKVIDIHGGRKIQPHRTSFIKPI